MSACANFDSLLALGSSKMSTSPDLFSSMQQRRTYAEEPPRWKVNITSMTDNRKLIMDLTKPINPTRRKLSEGNNMMDVTEEDSENKTEVNSGDSGGGGVFGSGGVQQPLSSSPTPFQSLQVHHSNMQSLPIPTPQQQQVLHPSINNLSFNGKDAAGLYAAKLMEPLKRSPLPMAGRLKEPVVFAPRTQVVRRLERSLMLDVNQQNPLSGLVTESPSNDRWFGNRRLGAGTSNSNNYNNNNINQQHNNNNNIWRTSKPTNNDFCLPNVPGASGSPSKGVKKKLNAVTPHSTMDPFISPRGNASRSPSESPKTRYNSNLPFV